MAGRLISRVPTLMAASALVIGACSTDDRSMVPVACKSGPDTIATALAGAPGAVEVEGTPLSGCLTPASDPADVQAVGASYVAVAADLAAVAREDSESPEATQLGYLVGAVRRGAGRTGGVHDELVRRLDQELSGVDTASAAFREGERAGLASG